MFFASTNHKLVRWDTKCLDSLFPLLKLSDSFICCHAILTDSGHTQEDFDGA